MKKIISIILFFLLWVNYTQADLSKYEESVKNYTNFSEFWLLENYLKNHKNKLILFQKKYEIWNNQKLTYYIWEIEKLEKIAGNIYKNKEINYDRKVIWEEIVKKIKIINTQLKEILIYEKYKFEQNLSKKHTAYSFISKEIGNNIYKRIDQQIETIKKSDLSKQNKLKIIIHLKNLEKNALYLKNFENMTFKNESQMKKTFTQVFQKIKQDLSEVNNLLQK